MTREEFIARAADAILKSDGFDPKLHPPLGSERGGIAYIRARAALDAVGAWETREAAKAVLDCHIFDDTEDIGKALSELGCALAKAEGK